MVPHMRLGAERRDDAANGVCAGGASVESTEAEHDGCDHDGHCAEHHLGDVPSAGTFEFAEEYASPEQAYERVRVPHGKGDGETDVADGEDGEGVCDGPECACEECPDDEVFLVSEVGEDVRRAFEQRGKRPARGEDAGDHAERDSEGREACVDELGGSFCRAKPYARGEAADDAEAMQGELALFHGDELCVGSH